MISPNSQKGQEKKALLIGFALILIVVLIAFIRPTFRKDDSKNNLKLGNEQESGSYPQISFSELKTKLDNNEKLKIIDLRTRDYYGSEHITDSINIPFEELEQSQITANTADLIVLLSQGLEEEKTMEFQAFSMIKKMGFSNVKVLAGGMLAWKNNNGQSISWGDPNSFADHSKVTYVTVDEIKKYIENKDYVFILDVRTLSSFSESHIPGAVNIPLDELEKRRTELPNGKVIAVYGDTDLQGFQAAVRLHDMDFLSVQAMRGSFSAWQEKKFEVAK